jgi:hypothetical protein
VAAWAAWAGWITKPKQTINYSSRVRNGPAVLLLTDIVIPSGVDGSLFVSNGSAPH